MHRDELSASDARQPAPRRVAGLTTLLAVLAAGCGGSDLGSTTTHDSVSTATPGSTVEIVMKSLDFSPKAVKASVGQTVTWTNEDQAPHNVTYVSGPRFTSSSPMMQFGKRFSIVLRQPGTIHYVCTLHPWMKATIIVSP
jgi:amicyanin